VDERTDAPTAVKQDELLRAVALGFLEAASSGAIVIDGFSLAADTDTSLQRQVVPIGGPLVVAADGHIDRPATGFERDLARQRLVSRLILRGEPFAAQLCQPGGGVGPAKPRTCVVSGSWLVVGAGKVVAAAVGQEQAPAALAGCRVAGKARVTVSQSVRAWSRIMPSAHHAEPATSQIALVRGTSVEAGNIGC
jgi:hypothetical protein